MLKNYFLIAFRNLIKNRVFSIVNILGLSIGIVACILISMYVHYERSYDRIYQNADDLYRVRWERTSEKGDNIQFASACPAVGRTLQEIFPEVEAHARIYQAKGVFSYEDKFYQEENVFWAENAYLKLLSFDLLKGNAENALVAENTAVISEDIACKYFGDEDPMGKFLSFDKRMKFEVTGVFKNRPENLHCKTDILISFPTIIRGWGAQVDNSWLYSGFYTYIKLRKGTDPKMIEAKIPQMLQQKIADLLEKYHLEMFFHLQPVKDIHLTSHYLQELEANGDAKTINFLFIIAYFIILIAWVNFINLSTISYLRRGKEVGLRKVVGATKRHVIGQFLMEALLINLLAVGLSIAMIEILMPFFRNLSGIAPSYFLWRQAWFYYNLVGMFLVGVFLSGMYPVWGLSFSRLSEMLKGDARRSRTGLMLRKGLVLLQFVISILLIAGTISVARQLQYLRNSDLGFNKERVVVLNTPTVGDSTLMSRRETFRSELLKNPRILSFAYSSVVPGKSTGNNLGSVYREGDDPNTSKNYRLVRVDYDYFELYQMRFLAGRNFSRNFPADAEGIVVNEKAAMHLGFANPEEGVDKRIVLGRGVVKIIGVVHNYCHRSPKEEVEPQIFHMPPAVYGYLSVKLTGSGMNESLTFIRDNYTRIFSGNPFDYYFLDEAYDLQYQDDERFSKVFGIFALLGLFLTCIGLLSLSAFTANQRKKEIGVRKVLGASVQRILIILSKEYILLLSLATLVVLPVFYWGLTFWLGNFAIQMDIPVWLFVVPMVVVAFISIFTVSYQSYKTANLNPVESIKYE